MGVGVGAGAGVAAGAGVELYRAFRGADGRSPGIAGPANLGAITAPGVRRACKENGTGVTPGLYGGACDGLAAIVVAG